MKRRFVRYRNYSYLYGRIIESAQVERAVPDLHRLLSRKEQPEPLSGDTAYVKTHFILSPEHPLRAFTGRCIYVLRNPRDELLSNARYFQMHATGPFDEELFVRSFIDNLGAQAWKQRNMGTWPQHAGSWLAASSAVPVLFIRFEDMRTDTAGTLERIVNFLELPFDRERVARAVAGCSLEEMARLEDKDKIAPGPSAFAGLASDKRFIGTGGMNQDLAQRYGSGIAALFDDRFGQYMRLFGY